MGKRKMTVMLNAKKLRIEKNLSQRQVADFLGIVESNYRRFENNKAKSITFKTLETLCRLFECSPNDLFELVDDSHDV